MRDEEMLGDFIEECEDAVVDIESSLISLGEEMDEDRLSSVLRQFHTIKGSAQSMDLGLIAELAHKSESTLVPLRGTTEVDQNTIDGLLKNVDSIRILNDALKDDPSVPLEDIAIPA